MTERDKIKQRIVKLLNLTTDKGASEAEAMQAAELMAHYDIQANELQIKSARAVSKHTLARRYGNLRIAVPTARHIAALCDCKYWLNREQGVTFFGLPADADVAAYLFDLIHAQREFSPHTRAKKLARAAECLVHSLTPSGVLAENHPKNRGFVGILRGQKCLKRRFLRRSPVGEWSRGARSMPRVFGRGSRSRPAALVSDRDECSFISGDPDPREIRFCKIR